MVGSDFSNVGTQLEDEHFVMEHPEKGSNACKVPPEWHGSELVMAENPESRPSHKSLQSLVVELRVMMSVP